MKGPRALPLLTLSPPSPEPAVPGVCVSARERRGAFFVASAAPSATARRNEIGQQKCSIRRRNAGNSSRNTPQREAGAGERGRAGGGAGPGVRRDDRVRGAVCAHCILSIYCFSSLFM